ncbi:hypothetical protein MIT9_P2146 [Methylomarinovum caldicuralii]|uniref:Tetratricopeptide repeat protein n=1 Tax=Methylomarinovum caldicuralii TaxID=438856 RepID=A0AAU9C5N5_9GAMM|nr:hypothetical protein [Methylomarinovum caldicuralii]BCX82560.1 hypothetical protein MIT9_P2146 [Methylomarinovum caldicuralii]
MRHLIIFLLLAMLAGHVLAKPADPAAQLDLAARMVKDRHYTRALGILLKQSLPEGDSDKDVAFRRRYHTIAGLAYLGLQQYPKARDELLQALAEGEAEPLLYVYLAQVYYRLGDYAKTIEAIDQTGALLDKYPQLYEFKAQSQWKLKQEGDAWKTLAQARRKFPQDARFLKRQVYFLLDKKLYRQAAELGLAYLNQVQGDAKAYAALGNALLRGGEPSLASVVLEKGRLRHPDDPILAKLLAHSYIRRDMPLAAALVLEQAARLDPNLYADAAELYRRAGALYEALNLNGKIPDPKRKRRQRLAILLALKRYEEALAMQRPLRRIGLLQEDAVRYALAYAAFKAGRLTQTETLLQGIRDPKIFRQAAELRRLIQQCEQQPWRCA